jgi:hypothetical protein
MNDAAFQLAILQERDYRSAVDFPADDHTWKMRNTNAS